jgi:hypothetical protein
MSERINKYIDPLSDFGFKHLFGGEKHITSSAETSG